MTAAHATAAPPPPFGSPSPEIGGGTESTQDLTRIRGGGGPRSGGGGVAALTAFAAALLAPAAAAAHPGDHTAMTVAQVAHHIVTSPDHLLEVVFAVLMIAGEGWRIRRRRAGR